MKMTELEMKGAGLERRARFRPYILYLAYSRCTK